MNALPRNYNPGRQHQWTFAQVDTMLEWLGEQIAATRAQLPGIWTDIIDWSPSSLPSSGDVKVSGGDRSDDGKKRSPSAEMAVRAMSSGCDPLVAAMNTVIAGTASMVMLQEQVSKHRVELLRADPQTVREVVFERKLLPGEGVCGNEACSHYCSGIGSDRIRGGRCDACRKARERLGRDRNHLEAHKIEDGPVGGCRLCEGRDAA